jgi:undecaprenyl-diphosphatase
VRAAGFAHRARVDLRWVASDDCRTPAGAAAALAVQGRRREGLSAFGAAAAMWLVGQGTKRLFGRPRPYEAVEGLRLLIDRPRGSSWPSSHPAVLLAFATVATRDLDAPTAVRAGTLGLAGLVGLSRVYLGVHYPADVAGGLLLGRGVADLWSAALSPGIVVTGPR